MRWNAVKKTAQWAVFRHSDGALQREVVILRSKMESLPLRQVSRRPSNGALSLREVKGMTQAFLIAAICGLAIGILSGLLGVGGGVVMVPLFRLAFGMDAITSTATSLFTIIPTSISGAVQHIRNKTCVPKLGLALGVGGACLSPIGVWLAQISPGWLVMAVAAIAIIYSAYTMLRKAIGLSNAAGQPDMTPESIPLYAATLAKAALIGACAGLASGYIGLGGGFLMIPLMSSLLNMPMRLASGTSLIAVMILAVPATIVQCVLGNVHYLVGIAVALGAIPGALVGARLVRLMPERALRFAFTAFLVIAAILLVAREFGMQ